MKLPIYVKNCIELLESAGYSAYAVGGAVRDGLLGIEPSDWDVTTSARPEEILSVFEGYRTIPTGIKHGTVTVLFDGEDGGHYPIEITAFRIDGEYRDSRHPESVSFSRDVSDDLSRRDFTVNAMAYNEKEGVVDLFGGRDDLQNRIIRAVGDPEKRFSEDALRILRAFRFSAQLGFEIEPKTLEAASICSHLLSNIARERIGVEFKKLISSRGASYSLKKMIDGGVWRELFYLPAPKNFEIEHISTLSDGNFATRLAILIAHLDNGEKEQLLNSLRLSNDEKKLVLRLDRIGIFSVVCAGRENETDARYFLHLWGDVLTPALEVLRFWMGESADFEALIIEESKRRRPLTISSLEVKGSDILPLCEGDHRQVGLILKSLLDCVIENPELNEKEKLMEIAKKNLS